MLLLSLKNTVLSIFNKLISLFEKKSKKNIDYAYKLSSLLGFDPNNVSIYKQAFYHSSLSNDVTLNNERLEFLGDSVLDTVVSEYIFKKYPKSTEGFLTKTRSKIVSRKSLGQVAESMGINSFISHNNLTIKKGSTISGNTLEALVGAIYIDVGFERTRNFIIQKIIRSHIDLNEIIKTDFNFKSQLVEWTQKNSAELEFRIVDEIDNKTYRIFVANVIVDGKVVGEGTGRNKKSAENEAAAQAMQLLLT